LEIILTPLITCNFIFNNYLSGGYLMFIRTPNTYPQVPMYTTMPANYPNLMVRQHEMPSFPKPQPEIPGTTTGGPTLEKQPGPPVLTVPKYSQTWLTEQLGKYIKVEFLIGTNMLIDREGILKEVGVNYIVLKESGTKDDLMCDMYSIKFVRVFDDQTKAIICK
jgi:hypothetical protein